MNGILVDSCVLLDLFTDDENWADWSENTLEQYSRTNSLYINSIVYTEVSIGFNTVEIVDTAIKSLGIKVLEMPREALFLTGKVHVKYIKNKGTKTSPLPDFFIGAHASVSHFKLVTRDITKYQSYFPQVKLIHPSE
ncbi:MAG: PIN domain-containing protein [Gammaproteobacteria bacterium]|nr:PIN domain-containing protein [Gammaproteobacteria bacterium]